MKAQLKWLVGYLRLYWLASVTYETWRLVLKPHTHGALVALWYQDKVLLVETSYRRSWGLPGPRFQESCHPSDQYIRGLEDMTNASIQRGRQS